MQVPFEENFTFDDAERQEYWEGSLTLWRNLSNINKEFLIIKWKNEQDDLGLFYDSDRHGNIKLHKMFADDIRGLTEEVFGESFKAPADFDGPIVNSDDDDDEDDLNSEL